MATIELQGGAQLTAVLQSLDEPAIRTIFNKVQARVLKKIQSEISAYLRNNGKGISLKKIKQRIRLTVIKSEGTARFWLGTDPINATWRGRAIKTKQGVRVKKQYYEGGFVAPNKAMIFRRSTEFRLPIEKILDDTFEDDVDNAWKQVEPRVKNFYTKLTTEAVETYFSRMA